MNYESPAENERQTQTMFGGSNGTHFDFTVRADTELTGYAKLRLTSNRLGGPQVRYSSDRGCAIGMYLHDRFNLGRPKTPDTALRRHSKVLDVLARGGNTGVGAVIAVFNMNQTEIQFASGRHFQFRQWLKKSVIVSFDRYWHMDVLDRPRDPL